MTDQEKRALKGEVLLEAAETEEHLAALRVKLARFGKLLEELGSHLQASPHYALEPRRHHQSGRLIDDAKEALSHADLLLLVEDYLATARRLDDLNAQKTQLGLRAVSA